jgi:hypothetical protein
MAEVRVSTAELLRAARAVPAARLWAAHRPDRRLAGRLEVAGKAHADRAVPRLADAPPRPIVPTGPSRQEEGPPHRTGVPPGPHRRHMTTAPIPIPHGRRQRGSATDHRRTGKPARPDAGAAPAARPSGADPCLSPSIPPGCTPVFIPSPSTRADDDRAAGHPPPKCHFKRRPLTCAFSSYFQGL